MKGTSWTQAAPFKEEKFCRTPSESIGNNYTPEARDLKIKDLYKRKAAPVVRGTCRLRVVNFFYFCIIFLIWGKNYCDMHNILQCMKTKRYHDI